MLKARASWSAAVLCRFAFTFGVSAHAKDSPWGGLAVVKAPGDWRTPKPGGSRTITGNTRCEPLTSAFGG